MKKEFLLAALMVGTAACAHNPAQPQTQEPGPARSMTAPAHRNPALNPEYRVSLAQAQGNIVKIDAIYKGCTADRHMLVTGESVLFPVATARPMTEQTLNQIGNLYAQTVGRNMDNLTFQLAPYAAHDPAIQETLPRITRQQSEIVARNAHEAGLAFVVGLLKQGLSITAPLAGPGAIINVSPAPVPECQ